MGFRAGNGSTVDHRRHAEAKDDDDGWIDGWRQEGVIFSLFFARRADKDGTLLKEEEEEEKRVLSSFPFSSSCLSVLVV